MKLYTIPVTWTMSGNVVISAESLDEAILEAEDADLPTDGDYIDCSFQIDHQALEDSILEAEAPDSAR